MCFCYSIHTISLIQFSGVWHTRLCSSRERVWAEDAGCVQSRPGGSGKLEQEAPTRLLPGNVGSHGPPYRRPNIACEYINLILLHVWLCLKHTGCICGAVIALLKVPLSFQRYFFQKLQSTSIKVSHLITLHAFRSFVSSAWPCRISIAIYTFEIFLLP